MKNMEIMMKRLHVATKDDIGELKRQCKDNTNSIQGIKSDVMDIRNELNEVKVDMPNAPRNMGGTVSSSGPTSTMIGWKPRLIHIRGFCPYGSGAS